VLELDAELTAADLTLDFFDQLEELQPFGVGNPKPLFLLKNLELNGAKKVGNDKHAQLTFAVGGQPVQGIAFNMAYVCDTVPVGSMVDLAAELIADTWNGMRRLKLRVVDLRVAL
jgi:single-stranded-DNA-specific exonuclease